MGGIYTELVGEFGRAVGGTVSAYETLAGGAGKLLNPVNLGLDVINFNIGNLISFLQVSKSMPPLSGTAAFREPVCSGPSGLGSVLVLHNPAPVSFV